MKNHIFRMAISLLRKAHLFSRKTVYQLWNRVLPSGEYISDRWEKAAFLGFGEGSSIYDSSHVFGDVKVGNHTWVGPFTILDGSGKLEIGSNCSISAGVHIYTHDSTRWAISGGEEEYEYAPVKLGDSCYIGPNVVISKGVTIGDRVIVGANSLVTTNIPSGTKVAGNPARPIEKH